MIAWAAALPGCGDRAGPTAGEAAAGAVGLAKRRMLAPPVSLKSLAFR